MFLQRVGGQQLLRDADGAGVLDEAIRRPVRDIGAEIRIEPHGRRPAAKLARVNRAPRRAVRIGRPARDFAAAARLPAVLFQQHPLCISELKIPAEMPFPNRRRAIPLLLEQPRQREPSGSDERLAEITNDARLQPRAPMIAPREQSVARRRTHTARCVRVGEAHPLRRKRVHVRRGDLAALRVVAPHIAIAEIVGKDEEDVRLVPASLRLGGTGLAAKNAKQHKLNDKTFHGFDGMPSSTATAAKPGVGAPLMPLALRFALSASRHFLFSPSHCRPRAKLSVQVPV